MNGDGLWFRKIEAGLSRFYSEGFAIWSREKFERMLPEGIRVDEPSVAEQLASWERRGFIRLSDQPEAFLTVLKDLAFEKT